MIVKGSVMPRPRVDTAVVERSHRPGVGRAAQKLRSVSFSGGAGAVPKTCPVCPRAVSDMPSTVPCGTDTDRPDSRPWSARAWKGRAATGGPHGIPEPGGTAGTGAVSLVGGARPGREPATATKRWTVPTGKVKFFDSEKGFGFVSGDGGEGDVFVPASALPEGVAGLKGGQRIEFSIAEGRRGAQALSVRLLDPAPSVSVNRRVRDRKPADEMVVIVEDVIKLLDSVSESLRRGHYPDKAHGNKVAQVLHAVAGDLEL